MANHTTSETTPETKSEPKIVYGTPQIARYEAGYRLGHSLVQARLDEECEAVGVRSGRADARRAVASGIRAAVAAARRQG